MRPLALALVLAAFAARGDDARDRVLLRDGKELHGRVLREDGKYLWLRQGERERRLERGRVEQVERLDRKLDALLAAARPSRLAQSTELAGLARTADTAGLPEAQLLWWRLLAAEPDSPAARSALGLAAPDGHTRVPFDGAELTIAQRSERARDWPAAWRFTSLHYEVTSTLPLVATLDAQLDLERFYRAFQDWLGAELGLSEVLTPMKVELHGSRASYPAGLAPSGHYEPERDTVYVPAPDGLDLRTLLHEATHQLLFVTAFRARGSTGEIPPWLNEGLAEYLAHSLVGTAPLVLERGLPCAAHFRALAEKGGANELEALLASRPEDFLAASGPGELYARAYTLVHFLLEGDGAAHRAGFLAYLGRVYAGAGAGRDLWKCLDLTPRALESAWREYVEREAR